MNREAAPLILAIVTPIFIVAILLLYFYGYDFTQLFQRVEWIYYVILFPFALGLSIAILRRKKPA